MARTRIILSAVALTLGTTLTGCAGNGLTPELHSYAESQEQFTYRHARVTDNNSRLIWSDLENILLLNRTSRLHSFPTP